jgi:hypothetical protein
MERFLFWFGVTMLILWLAMMALVVDSFSGGSI